MPAFITCVDDERLEFQDGELVTFSEIKGMEALNGLQARVKNVKVWPAALSVDSKTLELDFVKEMGMQGVKAHRWYSIMLLIAV